MSSEFPETGVREKLAQKVECLESGPWCERFSINLDPWDSNKTEEN